MDGDRVVTGVEIGELMGRSRGFGVRGCALPMMQETPAGPASRPETKASNPFPLAHLPDFRAKEIESAVYWAATLRNACIHRTSHVIAFGELVHAARLELRWGQWSGLFKSKCLPFGKSTGEKWSRIGAVFGPIAQAPEQLEKLPAVFEVLTHLARLGPELVLQLLGNGEIHNGLKERGAKALLRKYRPDPCPTKRPASVARLMARIRRLAASIEEEGATADWAGAATELHEISDRLRAKAAATRIMTREDRKFGI